jgi:hypothetical protein
MFDFFDPRRIRRESLWIVGGVIMVLGAAWIAPAHWAGWVGLLCAIVPTLAILKAASRSLLPAALTALIGAFLAIEVCLLALALLLIFGINSLPHGAANTRLDSDRQHG